MGQIRGAARMCASQKPCAGQFYIDTNSVIPILAELSPWALPCKSVALCCSARHDNSSDRSRPHSGKPVHGLLRERSSFGVLNCLLQVLQA